VSKRLSRSSCDLHRIVAQPFEFSRPKYKPDSSRRSPILRASNGTGVGKGRKIRPVNRSQASGGLSATAKFLDTFIGLSRMHEMHTIATDYRSVVRRETSTMQKLSTWGRRLETSARAVCAAFDAAFAKLLWPPVGYFSSTSCSVAASDLFLLAEVCSSSGKFRCLRSKMFTLSK